MQLRTGTITTSRRYTKIGRGAKRDIRLAINALEAHKAIDIVVLDLRNLSDATDFFIIASGSSDRHVKTLSEQVVEALRESGRRPHHVEGLAAGRWALLDFVDVVIHLFHPRLREYYQLERLWADAPLIGSEVSG